MGTSYISEGTYYKKTAPFRIFLYEDADYPNGSFTDGGTGPLNYFNYQLHTNDATTNETINGDQQVFTFNSLHPIRGNARVFQYSNTTTTWTQLGQTIEGKVDNATNVSLSNDGNTVSIGSSVVPPITARYLFYQLETENEHLMISEVEIYDNDGNNIALNKPSIESTTYGSTYLSSYINDGIIDSTVNFNFTQKVTGQRSWWAVDLGVDRQISSIKVYGRLHSSFIEETTYYSRVAPFRIFLYKDADYTVSFADGGTGPLNYDNYTLHTIDATTNETINGNQQVFTFNMNYSSHQKGNTRVFTYDTTTTTWSQIGEDIHGEETDYQNNINVLSGDGTIIAIGAPYNDGVNGTDSGHVRVYQRDSNKTIAVTDQTSASFGPVGWNRLGQDIDGYAAGDESGSSLSLSNDGFTVAIGAPKNDGTRTDSGHTRVYKYASANNSWTQIGLDIDGTASGDQFGSSVALSGDGTILVSGAPYTDLNGNNSGSVRVHQYGPSLSGILNLGDIMVGHGSGGITNTLLGRNSLLSNHNGTENTALGYYALYSNTTGYANTANGYQALKSNTTGDNNIAIGKSSGSHNTTGSFNTFLGSQSYTNGDYSYSTAVGFNVQITASNQIVLGTSGTTTHAKTLLTGSSSIFSDRRIKTNIVDVPDNLALQQVRDIPCRYYEYIDKMHKGNVNVVGFIAQEVKEVLPSAVRYITEYIPDEYRQLENISWEEITDTRGDIAYKMSSDLTDVSGITYQFFVSNDLSDNKFEKGTTGNADNTFTFDASYQYVFCYGKLVDDFHSIDKNQIFALHHSAIQEIDRLQFEEKEKTTALETKVTELETKNAELQTQLNSIMTILNNNNLS